MHNRVILKSLDELSNELLAPKPAAAPRTVLLDVATMAGAAGELPWLPRHLALRETWAFPLPMPRPHGGLNE